MSKTLMKQTLKSNFVLWFVMTAIMDACLVLIVKVGMDEAAAAQAYYALLPGLFSAVYIIITANKLLAAQVDKGSMAYILSTPIRRSTVAITQMIFFVVSLLLMFATTAATHIITANAANSNCDIALVLKINLGVFVLSLAFSGICFLASAVFNFSKYAIGVGGFFVGGFLLMKLMSSFSKESGDMLSYMRKCTIASLNDTASVLAGTSDYIWKFAVLAGIGLITYLIGICAFSKKDMPL